MTATTVAPVARAAAEQPRQARRLRMGLSVKIALAFLGLVSLLLIASGAVSMWLSYEEAKRAAVRVQQEKAQAAAERIDEFVAEIEQQIGWTTHAQWSAGSLDQRRYDFVRLLRQVPAITEVVEIDGAGKEQLRVSRLAMDVVGSGTDYSDDPRFAKAVADKVWFSPVYFRKESEPYMTIAAAHVGRKPGVTVAEVNLKFIWDVVSAIKVGAAGYAYVVNGQGRLIAHPDISLVLRDTDLSRFSQVAQALAARQRGSAPTTNVAAAGGPEGGSVLSAYAAIPRLDWLVFVELPLAEAMAPVYASLLQTGALLALGILLAAVAGTLLARRMTVPIRELQLGAERLGSGELDHRIELKTGDEIEELADRFNRMGAQLQDSYTTLEAKVEARTRDLAETLDQQTATSEVLQVISASPGNLTPVFDAMLDNALRLCEAKFGSLSRFRETGAEVVAMMNVPPAFAEWLREPRPGRGGPVLERMAAVKQVVHVADLAAEQAYLDRLPARVAAVELGGVRTMLAVPMLKAGELIGSFSIYRDEIRPFSEKQIELVTSFADQAVIAIENARLITETREALEQQTATAEVLGVINASPGDLAPVFDAILEKARTLCGATLGALFLCEPEQHFRAVAMKGGTEAWHERMRVGFRGSETPASAPLLLGERFVHVVDVAQVDHPMARAAVEAVGVRTLLSVPLRKDDRLCGMIIASGTPTRRSRCWRILRRRRSSRWKTRGS
jgi:GAF domain-containing protein/HAMP domain-containing protein